MNSKPEEGKDLFLGTLKKREKEARETILTGILYLDNIKNLPVEHIKEDKNGKNFIKVVVLEKRSPDNHGNTHNVKIDTYKPAER